MSSSDLIRWGGLWLGLLALSCSQGGGYEPRVHRLEPGWGLTTAPVSGVIEGENFLSVPTQHVGGEDAVTVDSDFEVYLGSRALDDVAWMDTRTLRVQIPEGLAPGWYPLTVVTPMGGRVELPRAYYASDRPLASLTTQAFVERPRLWMDEETHLVLTVNNPGGTRALGVRALLRPEEPGGVELLSEPEPEPLDVEAGGSASFSWKLAARRTGTAHFSLEVQGSEEMTGQELQVPPQSLQVDVRARVSSVLLVSPPVVTVGQPFKLTLRMTNDSEGRLRDLWPWRPSVEGVSAALPSEPTPKRVDLEPHESRDFVWNVVATSAGEGIFKVRSAAGTDELTGKEVTLAEVSSPPLTVLWRGALVVRFIQVPPSVRVGEVFDVEVSVDNVGQSEVRGVALDGAGLAQNSQTCHVWLFSGPTPRTVDLPSGQRAVFRAQLQTSQPGSCSFHVGAQGQDATDGLLVMAIPATSAAVPVTW